MNAAAYDINGQPASREAFYAIACDPRRSVAVEACAGAGKTWMLVSRIVRALLDGAAPHEVLAITFTRKAAGEMRQRLQEWLAAFAAEPDPEKRIQELISRGIGRIPASNGHQALQDLYRTVLAADRPVQIRTFHSWFAALLRAAPLAVLEALGLPGRFDLLERDDEAVAEVWRPFQAAVARDEGLRQDYHALAAVHGRSQTQKALAAALAKRTEFTLADAHGVVEASVPAFGQVFPELDGLAAPQDWLTQRADAPTLLLAAAQALGRASAPTVSAKGGALETAVSAGDWAGVVDALLTQKGEPRKFSDKLAGIEAVRAAQDAVLRIELAGAQHAAWLYQQRMARLTRCLLAEYAALKRARGWVDMNDVERAAHHLLADGDLAGWVQERLDARIKHLLIDEFQDTNPLQWQALSAWLAGYAGAGEAPGVFIVGDPKQSIYRFRRAEPQVFKAAQAFIREGLGGDLLACDHTRRNARGVIATVNAVMDAAQAGGRYDGFREHTTESSEAGAVLALPPIARPDKATADEPAEAVWRDSLLSPRHQPEETLRCLEARQAAAWVAAQVTSGVPPNEIMVLARQRDRLGPVDEALRALGIASVQPEKADLAEAPEVQDLVALLDVLVSPAHDLSLARALKSPLFSASDADLTALALLRRSRTETSGADGARGRRTGPAWLALLLAHANELPPALQAAAARIPRWREWVNQLPPHDALDAIFHDADVLARFAAAAPRTQRAGVLANLRALLAAALQIDGGRYLTPYALVRALRKGGLPAPARADAQAVRLLTIHGAKGLEAHCVLMLDTDARGARPDNMGVLVDWPGEDPVPQRFIFLASETSPPPGAVAVLEAEQRERRREELNALYVAMTRAKHTLALSCVQPHQDPGATAWRRIQPLAQSAAAAAPGPVGAPAAADTAFSMLVVPDPGADGSYPAIKKEVFKEAEESSLVSRQGQAMHWLLEHAHTGDLQDPARLARAAREFDLPLSLARDAAATARRIRTGDGAWAWEPTVIDWEGNEITLLHRGETLRLDRLVRRRDTGEWWILDYKSAERPEERPGLLDQMKRYREAVKKAHPGAAVRVAFLTGEGRVVEVRHDRGA